MRKRRRGVFEMSRTRTPVSRWSTYRRNMARANRLRVFGPGSRLRKLATTRIIAKIKAERKRSVRARLYFTNMLRNKGVPLALAKRIVDDYYGSRGATQYPRNRRFYRGIRV